MRAGGQTELSREPAGHSDRPSSRPGQHTGAAVATTCTKPDSLSLSLLLAYQLPVLASISITTHAGVRRAVPGTAHPGYQSLSRHTGYIPASNYTVAYAAAAASSRRRYVT